MTRLKKEGHVQGVLMRERKWIVKKPNGDVEVDPLCVRFYNDKWLEDVKLDSGEINYDFFVDRVSSRASGVLVRYLFDLRWGKNVPRGTRKGARSPYTVKHIRSRLPYIVNKLESVSGKDFVDLVEDDVIGFFGAMYFINIILIE